MKQAIKAELKDSVRCYGEAELLHKIFKICELTKSWKDPTHLYELLRAIIIVRGLKSLFGG